MPKKQKINPTIQTQMSQEWRIEISDKPFHDGKAANMPALGYPCAACASKETKLRFAESTDEVESSLEWMELQCRACQHYTLYTKK